MIDEKVLLKRLQKESDKWLDIWDKARFDGCYDHYADGMNDAFDEALEIVKELAEEHNNGWIPCEVRLPNKEEYLKYDGRFLVTDGNRVYQSYYDIYDEMFVRSWFASEFKKDKCVIAWQPLPAPYKKGE